MKKISSILTLMLFIFMTACEADKEMIKLNETLTPNDLSNLTSAIFVLKMDDAANEFQKFQWTDVDYGFEAVAKYTVQADKKANNFSSLIDLITVTGVNSASITVGDFNKKLLAAGLNPDEAVDLQFRVKAELSPAVNIIYSDVVEAKVTPYATSFPPIYMTGKATGGWGWDPYVYKELRSTGPNVYETIAYFLLTDPNESTFRFFKQIGWDPVSWNYPYFTGGVTPAALLVNADDGDKNLRFLGASGYYKITVNMTAKAVNLESVPDQVLYATGAALGGWDWTTNYIQLTWKSNGIYMSTTDFKNGETFRFFAQPDWNPTGYNYPWFETVSPLFENANDGDKNFKFIGTTGSYTITVNMLDKIVTMTQP